MNPISPEGDKIFDLIGCIYWSRASFLLSEAQPKKSIVNPPSPNLEMIASKLACFIKRTNIFMQRKMIQAMY
jgi:hypothetical protein